MILDSNSYLHYLLGVLMMLCATFMNAQDKIITKKGDEIRCTISRVGDEKIEYKDTRDDYDSIDKKYVDEIIFGTHPRRPIDFSDNTNKAIKFNLFSTVNNALQLSYEKALDPKYSIEVTLKVYGISIKDFPESKKGGGAELGYRVRVGDIFGENDKGNNVHVLDGIGIKPTIGGSYAEVTIEEAIEKYYYVYIGANLNYQAALKNRLLFEAYAGFHVFKGNNKVEFSNTPTLTGVLDFEDGDLIGNDNTAYSMGIKLGYLFGGFDRNTRLLRW